MDNNRSMIEQPVEKEQEIKLADYYRIIRRHLRLIIIIFLVVLGATIYYTIRAPRIYESSGKVLLELDKQTDLFFSTGGLGRRNDLNNQMEVIKSPKILRAAVEKLRRNPDAASFPLLTAQNPANVLGKNIDISAEREVDIFNVKYKSTSPVEAQTVVNSLIESYQEENLKYSRAELTNVRVFLEKQLDVTSKKLSISEEDLREFKIQNKTFALSEETTEMVENMGEFEGQLKIAQTDLKVANDKLSYLKRELTKLDSSLGKEIISISSPILEDLRKKLIEDESKLTRLLTKKDYTADHPELRALRGEIEKTKGQMRNEIDKILEVNEDTFDPLGRRQELLSDIVEGEVEYQRAKAKKAALENVVEQYTIKMSALPDAELQLARLERAKKINEEVYSMLVTRYEEAKISEEGKLSNIRVIKYAQLPGGPVSPKVKMNILIGIILGLGLGIGVAFLLENLNTKILNLSDVEKYIKLPILGSIPDIPLDEEKTEQINDDLKKANDPEQKKKLTTMQRQMASRLITHYSPKSPIAEAYRTFRTNVVSLPGVNSKTILVTSSGPKEGKSTSSSNLAITLAQMNSKTLLLDCDMRRPMIHNLFLVKRENGISKYLTNKDTKISDIAKNSGIDNLDVITSGHVPPNPSELLSSTRMDKLLEDAKSVYDYIVIDTPPIIAVTDALVLSKKIDTMVLVVRIRITDKGIIEHAKYLLNNIGVSVSGVIVNGIEVKKYYSGYKYYYYYYYYYYDESEKDKKKKGAKLPNLKKVLGKSKS